MAFPTTLDDLDATRGSATDKLSSPSHSGHHASEDAIIEALEAKVGIDGSAVTTSHDYKLSGVATNDKAVSLTGSEVLTNKTLTAPKINLGSDASQDFYKRKSDGTLERVALGSANQLLGVNAGGTSLEYLSLSGVTTDEKAALAGTSGTPSTTNKYVTNDDATTAKTADKIARRDANGDVLVSTTPSSGDSAVSKTYVSYTASDVLISSSDTLKQFNNRTTYTKTSEIKMFRPGVIRVKFDVAVDTAGKTIYGRIYLNGVATGTERTSTHEQPTYETFSEDITIAPGDLVQLYTKMSDTSFGRSANFRIYGTSIGNVPIVNL